MNNWRLLLLAVVVVVQPNGSFTESNLVDGRECCEPTEHFKVYGTGRRSVDENREDPRSTEQHRLKLFDESRGWRYERSLSRSERAERRLSLAPSTYPRDQAFSRSTSRKIREDQSRNRDESRSSVDKVERDSRESRSRDALDTTRSFTPSRDARDTRSLRQSRDSVSRLPIRNSRELEDRQASGRDADDSNREREVVARSGTRRDTRRTGTRFDHRIQLEDIKERRAFDGNTQAKRDNQRFWNARDAEIEDQISNGRNDREIRAVRAEFRRQSGIEFRDRMITDNRYTGNILDSRDDSESIRSRINARINDGLERQERDDKNRSFKDTLRNTNELRSSLSSQLRGGDTSDARLTRNSERKMRDERSSINRDETSDVGQQRGNRRATVSTDRTTSVHREQRNGNNKLNSRSRVVARWDKRESLDERRQRDNTRQRSVEVTRHRRETGLTEETKRAIRDSSEERKLQRDSSSRNHQSRENEFSDLRRQILEQGMERSIRMSSSAEQRQDVRVIRASRSVEGVRGGTRTTNIIDERQQTRKQENTIEHRMTRDAVSTQILVTRLLRTDNTPINRAARNRNDVRRTNERDMTERVVVRATRNVESPQRLAERESRTENIPLRRLVRTHAEVIENERRVVRHDDTRFDSNSSERVQAERRQDNRDTRNKISRNREVRMDKRLDSRHERDVFRRGSETFFAERRQDNREATRRDRKTIARNLNDVRVEAIISEHREESRDSNSRDVRGESMIVESERRERNRIARDSRVVSDQRNLEARRMFTRTRDSRVFRDETRGQRGDTRRSMIIMQRNSGVTKLFNERESGPEIDNERKTRNIERQSQRHIDNSRESRIVKRSNAVLIVTSPFPLRDDTFIKHQEGSMNVNANSDFVESEKPVGNWTFALYTLQGIYLCGLLVQLLTENGSKTKKRSFNWWTSHKDIIKVE